MRLEAAIQPDEGIYPWIGPGPGDMETAEPSSHAVISVLPMVEAILNDLGSRTGPGVISARFHNTISEIISVTAERISEISGLRTIALSGGTFQNRYLSGRVEQKLKEKGYRVLVPLKFPANDGGLALGQLAVAARQRALGKLI